MEHPAQRSAPRGSPYLARGRTWCAASTAGGPTIVKPLWERVGAAAGGGGRDEGGQTRRGAHREPPRRVAVCKNDGE